MNSSTLKLGGAAAIVLAIAAVWATSGDGNTRAAEEGGLLYPDLLKAVTDNRVGSLNVQTSTESFTVERSGEDWGMTERGGYPVEFDKVKEIVNQVAFFEIVEPKTSNPALYDRLQVEDVDAAEAKSSQVTIKDDSGAVLASLIVGKSNPTRGAGIGKPTLYVRKAGEDRSYEVAGKLYVNTTPTNWLDKEICKVDRKRVHRVRTEHADGEVLEVFKDDPEQANFTIVDLPEGEELKWAGVADGVGGALETLRFEDVQADDGSLDFEGDDVTVTRYQTFDGLQVTMRILQKEEKSYVKFSAAFDEASRVAVLPQEEPEPEVVGPEEEPTEGAEEEPPEEEAAPVPEVPGPPADEVAKEASELQAKLEPWIYVVPGYTAANFSKRMTDMIKVEEPAATGPEMSAPDSGIGPLPPGMEGLLEELGETSPDAPDDGTPDDGTPEEPPPSETPDGSAPEGGSGGGDGA